MSGEILERNIARLLSRSYVPALPAPLFRDRLEALFLTEVSSRARRARVRAASPAAPRLRLAVALAAAVVALLFGWRVLGRSERLGREELLASGRIALGFADDSGETWRAPSADELARGVALDGSRLTAVTPAAAAVEVRVPGGAVRVLERSELVVEERAEALFLELAHGRVELARSGTAPPSWTLLADPAALELVSGRAEAREEGERDRFLLVEGRASLRGPFGSLELAPGVEVRLDGGLPETTLAARTEDEGSARRPLPAAEDAPGEPPLTGSAPAGVAPALEGRVLEAENGQALSRFTVALLLERVSNEVEPPLVREFESTDGSFRWEDPPRGRLRVFVHAAGFALGHIGEIEAGSTVPLRAELVPGTSLRGTVVDADKNPVAGALVLSEMEVPSDGLFFHGTEQFLWLPIAATSGPDGRFELAHLNGGHHTVRVSAAGFAPEWIEDVRTPAQPGDELELELGPGGALEGTVTRADGSPWSAAQLVVVAMDLAQHPLMSFAMARTDADGRYRVEHLPAVTMIAVLLHEDDRPEVKPVEIRAGEVAVADFTSEPRGVRLHGRVFDAEGAPLVHQNLGLFDEELATWNQNWVATTTLEDGSYSFEGARPGSYLIFLIDEMGRGLRCVDAVLLPDLPQVEHDVHLERGTIRVTVWDGRSAEPLPEAFLVLEREEEDGGRSFSAQGFSDGRGVLTFSDLRPGAYHATAYPTRPGLGFSQSERLILTPAAPSAESELPLDEGCSVEVLVRGPDGRGLGGALVVFTDEQGAEHFFSRQTSAPDGRYRAYGLRPGRYRAEAVLPGHHGEPASFRLELGAPVEVTLELAPVDDDDEH